MTILRRMAWRFTLAVSLFLALNVGVEAADGVSEEAKQLCLETIKEMAGDKPPAEAVKLCEQGKLEDAIAVAMTGG